MEDYEKHIVDTSKSDQYSRSISYCGKIVSGEWAFTNAEHMLNTLKAEDRLLPCPECKREIIRLLSLEEEEQPKTLDTIASHWIVFDFMKLETRPPKYGKYLVCRKDGKIHWETWNGSGWPVF